jgi:hypothetical protein
MYNHCVLADACKPRIVQRQPHFTFKAIVIPLNRIYSLRLEQRNSGYLARLSKQYSFVGND